MGAFNHPFVKQASIASSDKRIVSLIYKSFRFFNDCFFLYQSIEAANCLSSMSALSKTGSNLLTLRCLCPKMFATNRFAVSCGKFVFGMPSPTAPTKTICSPFLFVLYVLFQTFIHFFSHFFHILF